MNQSTIYHWSISNHLTTNARRKQVKYLHDSWVWVRSSKRYVCVCTLHDWYIAFDEITGFIRKWWWQMCNICKNVWEREGIERLKSSKAIANAKGNIQTPNSVTNVRESNLIRSGTIANVYHYRFFLFISSAVPAHDPIYEEEKKKSSAKKNVYEFEIKLIPIVRARALVKTMATATTDVFYCKSKG